MKRNVLVFGGISGFISCIWMFVMMFMMPEGCDMENGMIYGYGSMLVANIFLFVGLKNYRDNHNGGYITFGKAFWIAFLIALIASTIYVVTWLIYYFGTGSDFIEKYSVAIIEQLEKSGASAAEITAQTAEMKEFAVLYQNPFFNAIVTYSEILPVGLLCALISAAILRKKNKTA